MRRQQEAGTRPAAIQALLDAVLNTLDASATAAEADRSFLRTARAAVSAAVPWQAEPLPFAPLALRSLAPACAALDDAAPALAPCGAAIMAARTDLAWYLRPHEGPDAAAFAAGHANARVLGPEAPEQREDIVVGLSLMAPGIAYPVHRHPPDELYLVLSDSEWWREEGGWFRPGIGGRVRNPPGVRHAMRAGEAPLLAAWILLP